MSVEALRAGIAGYVLKRSAARDLTKAIYEVTRGGLCFSPSISREAVRDFVLEDKPSSDLLTARERQVLQLIAEGRTTKEVAGVLGISPKTADSHRTRMMKKLGVHQTAGLVRYAVRNGLIRP